MKNIFITYNILFLLFGNTLFSCIHLLHDHDHNNCHDNNSVDCQECLAIDSSNTFILNKNELKFKKQIINDFFENVSKSKSYLRTKAFSSRAPPTTSSSNDFSLI